MYSKMVHFKHHAKQTFIACHRYFSLSLQSTFMYIITIIGQVPNSALTQICT